jgi:tartrate dehydratase beta subunit/fumarate hydratase class I family protein
MQKCRRHAEIGAVYLAAIGGAGAYLSERIVAAETIAYPELGPEALLKLEVHDFPCVVAIDAREIQSIKRPHFKVTVLADKSGRPFLV